ncbi:MAG: type II toxin-antitoxin system Phd/YefM family antitoxin [Egibacteraceae bacterium]
MDVVNVQEAKTHLSRLLDRVEQGEEIVFARNGRPVARLIPERGAARTPGRLRGRIRIGDDFDDPLPPDILTAFGGPSS